MILCMFFHLSLKVKEKERRRQEHNGRGRIRINRGNLEEDEAISLLGESSQGEKLGDSSS